jgi:hypothetical protein
LFSCTDLKTYNTYSVANFCVPNAEENLKKIADAFKQTTVIETAFSSLKTTSNLIWGSVIFSIIFSFFFSWLLEKCAGVVVAVSIIGFYAGAIYTSFVCYTNFKSNQELVNKDPDAVNFMAKNKMRFYQVSLFSISAVLSVVTCMICCLWSKLVLATKVIGVSTLLSCICLLITFIGCC